MPQTERKIFFRYHQYFGNIDPLKFGDAVEFEMTGDQRTGKQISSSVCKITTQLGEDMPRSFSRCQGLGDASSCQSKQVTK
ncbi:hypothetical protein NPIL_113001 [Nephila pilipes]|uniref:Uncharacterized protein n=1 Tax=Nephila pilipes TaxID=299642 RepID=A0A8X6UBB7_NEPPI|nr:hypothetical protein NPIL_113001 [Nephila pilipes]